MKRPNRERKSKLIQKAIQINGISETSREVRNMSGTTWKPELYHKTIREISAI
jgi:hypothetical protein